MSQPPNIALVVLDTLRKDSFEDYFDWLPGTRFENAWSTSHWTVPAHGSLFTGQYASEIGVYANASSLDCNEPVLAEQLREAGYTTRAFSANVNVSEQFAFNRGFDEFKGSWRLRALKENVFDWDEFIVTTAGEGPSRYLKALKECVTGDCDTIPSVKRGLLLKLRDIGIGAQTIDDGATEALDYVRETSFGKSEFLFLNLMEAHTPYNPPADYQTVEPPKLNGLEASLHSPDADPEHIRQAYADSVQYLSDMYEQIFEELRKEFDLIVTLSDHGEVLGEHGMWEHQCGLYPELTHIPLSIYTGEKKQAFRTNSVNLLDVHQTVLSTADVKGSSRGQDLRTVHDDRDCLTEYHGIYDRHYKSLLNKNITNIDHLRQKLLGIAHHDYYFYETFEGQNENKESPYDDPEKRMNNVISDLDRCHVKEDDDLDDAIIEQLEDLGYV